MKKNKKGLKRRIKRLLKRLLRNLIYLLVGSAYTIYLLIRAFDNLIVKMFMMLPRWSRAIIIWSMVASCLLNNTDIEKKVIKITNKLATAERLPLLLNSDSEEETKEVSKYNCSQSHETACKIEKKGLEIGMSKEQVKISIAISSWETGRWTSSAYYNRNNIGGMMCSSGLIIYNSLDEGIDAFLNNLKNNYFNIGLDTIEKIQPKYCPIGAKNDPTGLNKNWLNGVKKMYEELN